MTLQVSNRITQMVRDQVITDADAKRFATFVETCNRQLMTHNVITDNKYGQWFAQGDLNRDNVTHFVVQFSVFSNLFLIAQLHKMINASSLEGMRASNSPPRNWHLQQYLRLRCHKWNLTGHRKKPWRGYRGGVCPCH